MSKKVVFLVVVLCLIFVAVKFFTTSSTSNNGASPAGAVAAKGGKKPGGMAGFPIPVEVATVAKTNSTEQVITTGSLRAIQGIMVCPEIGGRITAIRFKPGDFVKKGAKLVQINPDILQATVDQDQANFTLAKQNYGRAVPMYREGVIAKVDLDQAVANLDAAKAALANAKAQLQQTDVVAAFTGKLGVNLVDLGNYVHAGDQLVSLQQLDPIDVEFGVPDIYLSQLTVGLKVSLTLDSFPGQVFTGEVYVIDSKVDKENRTVIVRAHIANPVGQLLPGAFVRVTLNLATTEAMSLPQTAMTYDAGNVFVYKVVDGKVVKTPVTTGTRDIHNVIITSGLKIGDTVVTAGQLKLHDGAAVIVVPATI